MNIQELLEYGKNNLIKKQAPLMVSKKLLKYILKVDDSYLLIHNEENLGENISSDFKEYIQKLNEEIPLQYITKNQEFMGLDFYVDENVLIPQPDTEILVEEVINICKNIDVLNILDLCTGSGAIGISLAKYLKDIKLTMTDISDKALEVAKRNAENNDVQEKCLILKSDMFEKIDGKFDVIVSNPPYIEKEVIITLEKEVQNEPILALDGGIDGLDFYKIIANSAYKYLNDKGILVVEIGYNQKEEVMKLLNETNKYEKIYAKKDLSGNDRVIVAERKK